MSVITLKCPNCDGELLFDPNSQKYKCEYCTSVFSKTDLDAFLSEEDASNTQKEATEQDTSTEQNKSAPLDAALYHCPSCGAEIVTDDTTAASFCYYCKNPVILEGRVSGEFLPEQLIPFFIDKKEAVRRFEQELGKRKFVPKYFFSKKKIEEINGIYFPYWKFDADMEGFYQANGTKTRVWIVGEIEFTETKFFEIRRDGAVALKNMKQLALKKANKELIEGVFPYRMDMTEKFDMSKLSGFFAEKRDISKEEMETVFESEAMDNADILMRSTVKGYQTVTKVNKDYKITKENFTYIMLPVWTITYKADNNKIYYYSLNGQTGKMYGILPVDYLKLGIFSAVSAILVLLLLLAGGYFIW
ncbi:MAG: TFIIB-type zinc ribbon-containing protein [Lachnospiraceae bacterium]